MAAGTERTAMNTAVIIMVSLWVGATVGFLAAAMCRVAADADANEPTQPVRPAPQRW
jgi:hypothetical protein